MADTLDSAALWTLARAKGALGITSSTHDSRVTAIINNVSREFDRVTRSTLGYNDHSATAVYLPADAVPKWGATELRLPLYPVWDITSVEVEDETTDIDVTGWDAQGDDIRLSGRRLQRIDGGVWPYGKANQIAIKYTGGYRPIPDSGTANMSEWLPHDLDFAGLNEIRARWTGEDRKQDRILSRGGGLGGSQTLMATPFKLATETIGVLMGVPSVLIMA